MNGPSGADRRGPRYSRRSSNPATAHRCIYTTTKTRRSTSSKEGCWCGEETFEAAAGATAVLLEGFFLDLDRLPSPGPDESGEIARRYGLEFLAA